MFTVRAAARRSVSALVSVLWLAACEASDTTVDASGINLVDAGDAGMADAAMPSAAMTSAAMTSAAIPSALEAGVGCESPLNPIAMDKSPQQNGCPCRVSDWAQREYCINGWSAFCASVTQPLDPAAANARWWFGYDGSCEPGVDQQAVVDLCRARRGSLVERGRRCPPGFGMLHPSSQGDRASAQGCCYPIDVPAAICTAGHLSVVAAGAESSLLDASCSNGGELRGFVRDDAGASGLCCTASR